MPTPTYIPLATKTLTASATSVTFSSISQAYRDLVLVVNHRGFDANGTAMFMRFNSDSGSNYSRVAMYGDGSTASSLFSSNTELDPLGWGGDATNYVAGIMNIMDYSATDKHKSILWRGNMPTQVVSAGAGRYASTTAITSFVLTAFSPRQFGAGSTFSLYGVSA